MIEFSVHAFRNADKALQTKGPILIDRGSASNAAGSRAIYFYYEPTEGGYELKASSTSQIDKADFKITKVGSEVDWLSEVKIEGAVSIKIECNQKKPETPVTGHAYITREGVTTITNFSLQNNIVEILNQDMLPFRKHVVSGWMLEWFGSHLSLLHETIHQVEDIRKSWKTEKAA